MSKREDEFSKPTLSHEDRYKDDEEPITVAEVGREMLWQIVGYGVLLVVSILLLPLFAALAVGVVVATPLLWLYFRIKNEPSKGRHAR